ncbi:MAG: hypothetical protein JWO13_3522 [Acidobacteriales bacterium]|nr:hypothetical protein [Terriglobales bacterium]
MGLLPECDILLTGPTDAGLADPGDCTAISLLQVTVALCALRPTLDNLVATRMMTQLADDIGESFIDAHENLLEDFEKFKADIAKAAIASH